MSRWVAVAAVFALAVVGGVTAVLIGRSPTGGGRRSEEGHRPTRLRIRSSRAAVPSRPARRPSRRSRSPVSGARFRARRARHGCSSCSPHLRDLSAGASAVASMLKRHPEWPLRVYVVWEAVLRADAGLRPAPMPASPTTGYGSSGIESCSCRRRWSRTCSRDRALPEEMDITPETVIWDVAAVYGPSAAWSDAACRFPYHGYPSWTWRRSWSGSRRGSERGLDEPRSDRLRRGVQGVQERLVQVVDVLGVAHFARRPDAHGPVDDQHVGRRSSGTFRDSPLASAAGSARRPPLGPAGESPRAAGCSRSGCSRG